MSEPGDPLSILLVGGHPADAFDNAGGTLAHHAAAGDRVVAAVMTHGGRSHAVTLIDRYRTGEQTRVQVDDVDRDVHEALDEKRDEVRGACAVMGIDAVRFLEYDDDILQEQEDLARQIADLVQEYRPDIVITHHPFDRGGVANTHSVCASMTLAAIDAAGGLLRNSTRRPHRVAQVFFMGVEPACASKDVLAAGMTVWCDVYVDITDVIERKVAALDMMRSQNYQGAYARKRVEAVDGHFGLFSGVAYAEVFSSMRPQVYDRLPITPHSRLRASEQTEDWNARTCRLLGSTPGQGAAPDSPQPQPQASVPQMLECTWSAGPLLPQGLQDNCTEVMDNWLVSVGGFCGGLDDNWKPGTYPRGFLDKVWGLNLADEAAGWLSLPPLPAAGRQAMQATVVDDRLYAWGGFNYTAPFTHGDGYRLSLEGGAWAWEALPPLPCPSAWGGAYALGTRIYLLGGTDYDRQRFYTLTDRSGAAKRLGARLIMFDTEDPGSGWHELTPCPGTPRCIPAAAVVDGKLYSIGGVAVSDSGAFLNAVDSWRYDPASDSWERLRDLPMTGSGSHSGIRVYENRYILLPAGYQYEHYTTPDGSVLPKYGDPSTVARTWENHPAFKDKHYFNHFYVYDICTDLYGTATSLPLDAVHPPTIVRGDSLYVFPSETAGFVWQGEYYGHHPELVLKGAIEVLDWEWRVSP